MHNIVTVILKTPPSGVAPKKALLIKTVQDSVDWVAAYHQALLDRFLALYEKCTSPEQTDLEGASVLAARLYAEGLGNWVRANDQWSFESVRYFGTRGVEVQATRLVELLPLRA